MASNAKVRVFFKKSRYSKLDDLPSIVVSPVGEKGEKRDKQSASVAAQKVGVDSGEMVTCYESIYLSRENWDLLKETDWDDVKDATS